MTQSANPGPTRVRPYEEMLAAYTGGADLEAWLRGELDTFLSAGANSDPGRVDALLELLAARQPALAATVIPKGGLAAFEIEVFGAAGVSELAFRELPHPVEVLWTVARHACPGDSVRFTHHYIDDVVVATLRWPFGVDAAVLVTSPNPRTAYPEAGLGDLEASPTDTVEVLAPRRPTHSGWALVAGAAALAGLGILRRRR